MSPRTYEASKLANCLILASRVWPEGPDPLAGKDLDGLVAGGRFELYSAYPILVRAVPASVIATG
jgi:hypothetical protein